MDEQEREKEKKEKTVWEDNRIYASKKIVFSEE